MNENGLNGFEEKFKLYLSFSTHPSLKVKFLFEESRQIRSPEAPEHVTLSESPSIRLTTFFESDTQPAATDRTTLKLEAWLSALK